MRIPDITRSTITNCIVLIGFKTKSQSRVHQNFLPIIVYKNCSRQDRRENITNKYYLVLTVCYGGPCTTYSALPLIRTMKNIVDPKLYTYYGGQLVSDPLGYYRFSFFLILLMYHIIYTMYSIIFEYTMLHLCPPFYGL